MLKLHVGSGSVFLRGYLNIDLPGDNVYLASERLDLVEKYLTLESDYYGRHKNQSHESLRGGPVRRESVCDAYGSFTFLPARKATVVEILSRQTFEHLAPTEGMAALRECYRVMKYDALLRIDVPDPDETLQAYKETGDLFWVRHLFGPRRDEYGGHTPYSRDMIKAMAYEAGFHFVEEEINVHFYPAFMLRFAK